MNRPFSILFSLSLLVGVSVPFFTWESAAGEAFPRSIVDQNGVTVEIPERIERLVMLAMPLPSAYALTGKSADMVVGMHPGSKSAIESSIMGVMYPDLLKAKTDFIEVENLNLEELMKLTPDIVFYWGDFLGQGELLKKAGIPAVAVKTQGDGDAIMTFETWMNILGEVFDARSEVDAVVWHARAIQAEIAEKAERIPEAERLKTLILHRNTDTEIVVHGRGMFGCFWIEKTGGISVTRNLSGNASITMEEIYAWDPDVIIISSFSPAMPEDLYDDRFPGQNWRALKAVRNKRVYKEPVGVYRWYPPSGDVPLMLMWMANVQYPDLFPYDMPIEVKNYYRNFYKFELTDEQVDGILNTSSKASAGTKF